MSKSKYIPILFKPEMVNAILEGRKTQTRREAWLGLPTMKPTPCDFDTEAAMVEVEYMENLYANTGKLIEETKGNREWIRCPYGKPGDVLWVREMWGQPSQQEMNPGYGAVYYCYKADNSIYHTYTKTGQMVKLEHEYTLSKYKPSIHMPKAACRIFLEITEVKVERLKDISEADAMAEGMIKFDSCAYHHNPTATDDDTYMSPYGAFKNLWETINGADSWQANPFVWAIRFKRIHKPANWPNHA